jgi:integrase
MDGLREKHAPTYDVRDNRNGRAALERPRPGTRRYVLMQGKSLQQRRLVKTSTPGVYKRGDRYVVVYRDPHGRQRKAAARTLAEARELKATLTADVKRGEYRATSKVTFAAYATEWIASYQGRTSRGIRPETLADYRHDLGLDDEGKPTGGGAVAFFGRTQLAAIEPRDVKRYAAELAARGLAPGSVRNVLAPVRALLATAYEDGLIRGNPAAGLRIVQRQDVEHDGQAVKALTEDELRALLAALPDDWRLFFEFLAHTGLRIGEAVALTWADVDFGKRRLRVRRRLYKGRFDAPKSKYGRRTIPLSPRLAQALWRLQGNASDDAPLFASANGTYLDPSNVAARILKPAARWAGVPWASFHTFRHTCATMLFRHGLNAKQVQMWLGHHSPAFTLATYVHLLPDDLPDGSFLDAVTGNTGATEPTENDRNEDAARQAETLIYPAFTNTAEVTLASF